MNNEPDEDKNFDVQILDRLAAIKALKEHNILTQDEIYTLYACIRSELGLPPRDFKNENIKLDLGHRVLDQSLLRWNIVDEKKEDER